MRIAEAQSSCSSKVGCAGDPSDRCGSGLEKIYPTSAVRFGYLKHIGEFKYKSGMTFGCGCKVVIQTSRGIEIGDQVSLTCTGCSKSISRDQMRDYARNSGEGYLDLACGRILREATEDDLREDRHIRENAKERLSRCKEFVGRLNMPMKMVECEHLFGGERIIFYFMSASRVDFRDLVKELAQEYHTRIEMRQVGARDEARLVADYETCGQECCCKTFLKTLKPISMKMAKMQKATLDPSKVSGRCGRLKCCLRYEHTTYEELDKLLPKIGRRIQTAEGEGIVVDRQILTQLLQVELNDMRRIAVAIEDVLTAKDLEKPKTDPSAPTSGDAAERKPDSAQSRAPEQKQRDPKGETPAEEQQKKPRRKRRRRRRWSKRSGDNSGPSSPDSSRN